MTRFVIACLLGALALAPTAGFVTLGCATPAAPPPKPAPPPPPPPEPDHPRTWDEVPDFYGTMCPPPAFELDEPHTKSVGGVTWTVEGSVARREGRWSGPLIIGVLGAVKDAQEATRKNLQKAKAAFAKAKVNVVLLNGDVAETAEISDVVAMIGAIFGDTWPLLVHSGNSEWTSGFTNAFFELEKKHPSVFNLNLIRELDLGGVVIVSLPGWSVKDFVKPGGCYYQERHVDEVRERLETISDRGDLPILTAHGPPRGPGKASLDRTWEFGNVGDPSLAELLTGDLVDIGIFGHILEAGGRATSDPVTHKPLKLPQKAPAKRLFVNVGSASATGIELLTKKTSRGMAAIVTVATDTRLASVTFIKLRS
jgi:Icc-related predicted phosphoesterase